MTPENKPSGSSLYAAVNLLGRLRDGIGLGEVARQVRNALESGGLSVHDTSLIDAHLPHRINLLYTGMPDVLSLPPEQRRFLKTGRYTIAQYFWELPRLVTAFRPALDIADEIWAASRFTQQIFTGASPLQVHLIPPPITVTPSANIRRASFGLPDERTIFFFNFNITSHYARKNPAGLIEAFRRGFGKARADSPLLVLKSQFLEYYPPLYHHLAGLMDEIGGVLINRMMTRQQTTDLMACADVYVSLHRAEGFGLGMAEAMLLGKPVIATNYSGNTDFMTLENSYPVGFTPRPIAPEDHRFQPDFETIYEVGQHWAEPDIDEAAAYMAHLVAHPADGQHRGEQAARDIARRYAPPVVTDAIIARLAQIDFSALPDTLPPDTQITPSALPLSTPLLKVERRWIDYSRRLYHAAVPTPLRLGFRRLRHPKSWLDTVPEMKSMHFRAAAHLAIRCGHAHIVVLGDANRDDIRAIAQRFRVLLIGTSGSPQRRWDSPNIQAHPVHAPLPRTVLQQSILIARLHNAKAFSLALPVLKAAAETGAVSIVSAVTDAADSLEQLTQQLAFEGLPVWLNGYADGLYTAIIGYPEAPFASPPPDYHIVALLTAGDSTAKRHFIAQGIEVRTIDGDQAHHAHELRIDADWVIKGNSHEILESFDRTHTLRDTLYQIDRGGFNVVVETRLHFDAQGGLFSFDRHPEPPDSAQFKIWKPEKAALPTGTARYPFNFLTRQYPPQVADVENLPAPDASFYERYLLERLLGGTL